MDGGAEEDNDCTHQETHPGEEHHLLIFDKEICSGSERPEEDGYRTHIFEETIPGKEHHRPIVVDKEAVSCRGCAEEDLVIALSRR